MSRRVLLSALLLSSVCAWAASPTRMYVCSDLHYDIFYGTPTAVGPCTSPSAAPAISAPTCDGSPALIASAIDDVFGRMATDGDGVLLVLGDNVRHGMTQFANLSAPTYMERYALPLRLAKEITTSVYSTIAKAAANSSLPRANILSHPSVVPVLGNNDCVPDYFFNESATIHPALADFAQVLRSTGALSAPEAAAFAQCGAYSRLVQVAYPPVPLLILSINTMLYLTAPPPAPSGSSSTPSGSSSSSGIPSSFDGAASPSSPRTSAFVASADDPCGQFAWMTSELERAAANGWRVFVIGHVLPVPEKWNNDFRARYVALLQQYNDIVAAQFYSHRHMLTFIAMSADDSTPPLFDLPSISPVDGNNPSYVAIDFDPTWRVQEIHHRILGPDRATWTDGTPVAEALSLPQPITTSSLYALSQALLAADKSSDAWQTFEQVYQGGVITNPLGHKDKAKVICQMFTATDSEYEQCKADNE